MVKFVVQVEFQRKEKEEKKRFIEGRQKRKTVGGGAVTTLKSLVSFLL